MLTAQTPMTNMNEDASFTMGDLLEPPAAREPSEDTINVGPGCD
jgi:hypothetical protein